MKSFFKKGAKVIEIDTFPDEDEFYCKMFLVPYNWLVNALYIGRNINETLENFYKVYTWDDTWELYTRAYDEGVIIEERNIY